MSNCLRGEHSSLVWFRNDEGMWRVCRECGEMMKANKKKARAAPP